MGGERLSGTRGQSHKRQRGGNAQQEDGGGPDTDLEQGPAPWRGGEGLRGKSSPSLPTSFPFPPHC